MAGTPSSESPLDAVADTVGERTAEAFEILGNDTRLAILVALWEIKHLDLPMPEQSEWALSFSELREAVGQPDSGQFNYHLDKLTGRFVEQTEAGYTLTQRAEQILRAIFAGTLADPASLEAEPLDMECFRCGEPTVLDYGDGMLIVRCTSCEGTFRRSDDPSGLLTEKYRPPVGLANRTPEEFRRHGNIWDRHRILSMIEGVCPDCSGSVTTTLYVCDAHDTDRTVCEHCETSFEIHSLFACDVCKNFWHTPAWYIILTEIAVLAFFHEHGLDPFEDENPTDEILNAVEVAVRDEEPIKLEVTVDLDGDRLTVTLDNQGEVRGVSEETT